MSFERRSGQSDEGFGLVESVVTIFVLALLTLMLAPVLIQSIRISDYNNMLVAANQLVSERTDYLRRNVHTCSDLMVEVFDLPATNVTLADGRVVEVRIAADGWQDCYSQNYPASARTFVSATEISTNREISSAYTLVDLHGD